MSLLALVPDPFYAADAVFDPANNRDDILCGYLRLRDRLAAGGDRCHTLDTVVAAGERPDALLFCDLPEGGVAARVPAGLMDVPRLLMLQECEVVLPRNWVDGAHDGFDAIFTWRDPLVDGKRYRKLNFASALAQPPAVDLDAAERNLCTLIASNKHSAHPLELYSHRVGAIRWFEQHRYADFELHGFGWGAPGSEFPSWCGAPAAKRPVLERFWFSICFENAQRIPGYITEKLFDSLQAGNVPVYWGAENIADHVPADCFIDARAYASYEALYDRLTTIEPEEYRAYLTAAARFLAGPAQSTFSADAFAETIIATLGWSGAP